MNPSNILYEDNHLIVINKAPGELIQGDKTGDVPLVDKVKAYIKLKYNKPGAVFLGVVHRLDRPTSGAVVFARTSKALTRLNLQFNERKTKKIYWALVGNPFTSENGNLTHWMFRNQQKNKSKAFLKEVPNSKKAILEYLKKKELDHYSLLEIVLKTGRHHQIRAQLTAIGHPIKGDLKYGAKRSNPDGSICLHARRLDLDHPVTKERLEFIAPPPKTALWDAVLSD
ncbi:RluA family pseudouridine synthase [Flavobacteriaceae bacterium]|nr:RluA family pseudouridine synthase [Flavobacteriaceae bacterium]